MKHTLALLATAWLPWLAGAATDPAIIDSCQYASEAAAKAAWQPMRGSAAVAPGEAGGERGVRMPCNFTGTTMERASWDRAVNVDLSTSRGIQFQIWCRDTAPISGFSVYFQSGEGWYSTTFFPETTNGWSTVTIEKAAARSEGKPAGWSKIRTLRISAWHGKDANTEFFLRDIRRTGVLGTDSLVAVLRADSAVHADRAEAKSIEEFSEQMATTFQGLGLPSAMVSDLDVTLEQLRAAKLVVLPHNPRLPDSVADALVQYVQQGGKLMVFYSVPAKLLAVLGVQAGAHVREPSPGYFSTIRFAADAVPGAPPHVAQHSWNVHSYKPVAGQGRVLADWLDAQGKPTGHAAILGSAHGIVMTHVLLQDGGAAKRRMLLAMAGSLVPELWQRTAANALAQAGNFAGYQGMDDAISRITAISGDRAAVNTALAAAKSARQAHAQLCSQAKYGEALDQAEIVRHSLLEAYCRAQTAQLAEFRAFWCHSAFGVNGMEWDEAIRRLAESGFTAILPNMLWGGSAFYPSDLLPVVPEVATRGDQIAKCLVACRKYGVQIHVWKVNWNTGHHVPKSFLDKMRQEQRLQADAQGKEEPWLCPSHPENQKLEIATMVEVARKYPVDGIHFDYIRYPDGSHCFCAGCRERFEKVLGASLKNWPRAVQADGAQRARWLDWRRENITTVVKAVSEQARQIRPGIKISAAVFRHWTTDRDSVGQDWKLWCDRGYVDFLCPMDYTPSNTSFENMVRQQVEWAGKVPIYPGIGISTFHQMMPDRVIEQIQISRKNHTGGFTIFNYGETEARDLIPLLGMGITAPAGRGTR